LREEPEEKEGKDDQVSFCGKGGRRKRGGREIFLLEDVAGSISAKTAGTRKGKK